MRPEAIDFAMSDCLEQGESARTASGIS